MLNNHWESVHGWFDYANIYDKAVELAKDGDILVEIGTWMGKSTCYLAQKLKEKGVKVKFYACDLFLRPSANDIDFLKIYLRLTDKEFYEIFIDNLKKQEVTDIVIPVKANSLDFGKTFEDKSISFLFLDNDHNPSHVFKELLLWYPKMKQRSILAGHDKVPVQGALDNFKLVESSFDYILDGNSWISYIGE